MTAPMTLPPEAETAPELERKDVPLAAEAAVTAVTVAPEGIVKAIVSVTGVVDEVRDVIEPGAYTETLKKRRPKVVRNHQWSEQVGRVLDIEEYRPGDPRLPKETKDGRPWPSAAGALVATIQYNLATDRGRRAYEDVKFFHESKEAEFSIGYQVPPGASVRGHDGIRRIKRLDLFEVCDVLFGAASLSMSLDVKSAVAQPSGQDGEAAAITEAAPEGLEPVDAPAGDGIEPVAPAEEAPAEDGSADEPTDEPAAGEFTEAELIELADLHAAAAEEVEAEHEAATAEEDTEQPEPVAETKTAVTEEHSYFPAEDARSCECGLPADAALHTDTAEIKAMYAALETGLSAMEAKAADTKPGDGNIEKLRAWYLNPARSRIRWGQAGDWEQCRRIARKHMKKPGMAEGFCARLHKTATGEWPGKNAHGGKKTAEPEAAAEITVDSPEQTVTSSAPQVTWTEPVYGDGTGEALPPIETEAESENETKLLEWSPAAEVGPLAAHQNSAEAKRVTGPGPDDSLENRRERIRAAVTERLAEEDGADEDVTLLGTWPDRAIAARISYDADGVTAHQAYTVPYDIDDAGEVHVGDPEPVELTIDHTDTEPSADTQELAQRVAANLAATVNTALDEATLAGKTLAAAMTGHEVKSGRVLSRVNVTRLQQAVTALIAVLRAAGVDVVPPSEQQVRDVQTDGGGEPPVAPDSTSPGLREKKTAEEGAVLTFAELAEGLTLLAEAAALDAQVPK